jgi:energy-coupling factor transport system ATP-binding protein
VAIAGVLAMEPNTIILDEPTAGLDPHGRNDLLTRLKMLHKEKNITIIIVSHSMEEIADTVEKVIVLSKGELVMFDTVAEVFKKSDLLSSIGLDTPQVCSVITRLKEKGINLPDGVFEVEKIADIIYDSLKGAKNA